MSPRPFLTNFDCSRTHGVSCSWYIIHLKYRKCVWLESCIYQYYFVMREYYYYYYLLWGLIFFAVSFAPRDLVKVLREIIDVTRQSRSRGRLVIKDPCRTGNVFPRRRTRRGLAGNRDALRKERSGTRMWIRRQDRLANVFNLIQQVLCQCRAVLGLFKKVMLQQRRGRRSFRRIFLKTQSRHVFKVSRKLMSTSIVL